MGGRGGWSDAGREEQRQQLSCKTGTDPARVLPRAAPALPRGTRCRPAQKAAPPSPPPEPFIPFPGSRWASPAQRGGCSRVAPPPHPTPAPSQGMQDRGIPNATASCGRGCPPSPGWEVPPVARLGPESGRAAGAVSILRGALLEKEQKLREAINSRLLHTSASSAPASHGQGGSHSMAHAQPCHHPPHPPTPASFSGQHLHPKTRGNKALGNICRRSRTGSEQPFAKLPDGSAQPQPGSRGICRCPARLCTHKHPSGPDSATWECSSCPGTALPCPGCGWQGAGRAERLGQTYFQGFNPFCLKDLFFFFPLSLFFFSPFFFSFFFLFPHGKDGV